MKIKKISIINDFNSLLKPILFFIFGIIMFTNPAGLIQMVLYLFSLAVFVIGLFRLLFYYRNPLDKKEVLHGLIYMLLGIIVAVFTFFAFSAIETILRYSLAVLLLYTAVFRIVASFKKPKPLKLVYIITSAILVLMAILLICLNIKINICGLFIILFSIIEIIGYIFNKKYAEEVAKIPEGNIVGEKEELAIRDEK